jgi:hypothetical protein
VTPLYERRAASQAGVLGGRKDRAKSRRPLVQRLKASRNRLWTRYAAGRLAHRRQPHRHDADGPACGRGPARARTPGATTAPAAQSLRRSSLALARRAQRGASAPHPGTDRLAEERARLRAWDKAMGRRAHARLAAPVPSAAHPLRAPRRHPRSVPRDRLQLDLSQAAPPGECTLRCSLAPPILVRLRSCRVSCGSRSSSARMS